MIWRRIQWAPCQWMAEQGGRKGGRENLKKQKSLYDGEKQRQGAMDSSKKACCKGQPLCINRGSWKFIKIALECERGRINDCNVKDIQTK